jgi:hypothetical protein
MRVNKSGLMLGLSFGTLVFLGSNTLALQAIAASPAQEQQQRPNQQPTQPVPNETQPNPAPPMQDQSSSSTFTGTVVKSGDQFLLKDPSGEVYKLDDSTRAQSFEGKSVKVTGKLDTDAKLIHVETIEAA